ncbi:MAG: hypothetical protein NC403_09470 [Muribaculaceae bacterium]|nr:hypothetical protein [Muribaculaceae bacterium]
MLGIAVGCIGLPFDEFCALEFDEFESICEAWRKMNEQQTREAWERTRLLATICIQPHIKKKITPKQLMPLPWDKKATRRKAPKQTAEEKQKRFEDVAKRLGDQINK